MVLLQYQIVLRYTLFLLLLRISSQKQGLKIEARLYGHKITTQNFGTFEMFSWMGNVQAARKLIIKASKRFKIKIIEGGYKTKEKIFHMKKSELLDAISFQRR